jgi:LysM repeat protein
VVPTPPPTFDYFVYHVRRGDTLYSLGARFGLGWQEIQETNGIAEPDLLRPGKNRTCCVPERRS